MPKRTLLRPTLRNSMGVLLLCALTPGYAGLPMFTDDADTLDAGQMQIQGVHVQIDRARTQEVIFGFSPIENLEMEVAGGYGRDTGETPETRHRNLHWGIKWVPWRQEQGLSMGARVDYTRTRTTEQGESGRTYDTEYSVTGLASYRLEDGQALHFNLGKTRNRENGHTESHSTWGLGYAYPLATHTELTAEIFGQSGSRPDKAIGLRHEIAEGLTVAGALGRGNDRNFGLVGFSWAF